MIEEPHHRLAAAVRNLEQRRAITAVQIPGPENVEVGGELDQSLPVARRLVEINDDLVVWVVRVNSEVDFGDDLLVSARQAKLFAVEQVGAGDNFNAGDAGLNGQDEEQRRDCLQNYVFGSHSSLRVVRKVRSIPDTHCSVKRNDRGRSLTPFLSQS